MWRRSLLAEGGVTVTFFVLGWLTEPSTLGAAHRSRGTQNRMAGEPHPLISELTPTVFYEETAPATHICPRMHPASRCTATRLRASL